MRSGRATFLEKFFAFCRGASCKERVGIARSLHIGHRLKNDFAEVEDGTSFPSSSPGRVVHLLKDDSVKVKDGTSYTNKNAAMPDRDGALPCPRVLVTGARAYSCSILSPCHQLIASGTSRYVMKNEICDEERDDDDEQEKEDL